MKVVNALVLFGALAAAQNLFDDIAGELSSIISAGPSAISNFDELTASLGSQLSDATMSITGTGSRTETESESTTSTQLTTSTGTETSTFLSTSEVVQTQVSTIVTETGGSTITSLQTSVVTTETVISSESKIKTTVTTSPNAAPTKFVAAGAAAMAVGGMIVGAMV